MYPDGHPGQPLIGHLASPARALLAYPSPPGGGGRDDKFAGARSLNKGESMAPTRARIRTAFASEVGPGKLKQTPAA